MTPYIKYIAGTNLKNGDFKIELSPLALITGKNGQGKSRVKDALFLALLGYHPDLGKKPAAFSRLSGPGLKFEATAVFSDMTGVSRGWKKTRTGASSLPGNETIPPINLACLDTRAFLGLSPVKQAAMIAASAGMKSDFQADIAAKVRESLPAQLATDLSVPKNEDFALWTEEFTEILKAKKNEAAAIEKRMSTTLQGMMSLEADTVTAISREIIEAARARKAKAAAEAELAASAVQSLEYELAKLPQEWDEMPPGNIEAINARLEELKAIIEPLNQAHRDYQGASSVRTNLTHHITTLEKELERRKADANTPSLEVNPPSWLPESESAKEWEDKLDEEMRFARDKRTRAIIEKENAARDIERANKNVLKGELCPCCGAHREHWDEQKQWDSEQGIEDAKVKLAEACRAFTDADSAVDELTSRTQELKSYLSQVAANALIVANAKEFDVLSERLEGYRKSAAELPSWEPEQAEDLDAFETEREELMKQAEALKEFSQAADIEKQRREIEAQISKAKEKKLLFEQEWESASVELAELEKKATEADAARAREQEQDKARKEAQAAATEKEAWDTALEVLQKECNEQTVKVFAPLLKVAREITAGCLPTELDNNGLELGRYEGAHFIGLSTFSGSEQAVALAGILCAMAANGSGLVLIDEFSTFDEDKKTVFIDNLARAINSNTITQAILLDSREYLGSLPEPGAVVKL